MIRLIVNGAAGHMGRLLCAAAEQDERFALIGALDREPAVSVPVASGEPVEAIIDFSSDEGTRRAADLAALTGAALLVGTTALSRQTLDAVEESARSVAVMVAPNTSRGVAVLSHLAAEAARLLGARYAIDVLEQHHERKRDAPSGTALRLAGAIGEATGRRVPSDRMHSVRAGDIIGDHEVQFTGVSERLRLVHNVASREVFVAGALDAMAWLVTRPPGRYTIEQSLGLEIAVS